jgi:large subunit ribosomal protein L6
MSRIGKSMIPIPKGVEVKFASGVINVKGPKGVLESTIPAFLETKIEDGELRFLRADEKKDTRSIHGLTRALVANMIRGVSHGFEKALEIQGVGYRAEVKGKNLNLSLGFSHIVELPVPEGLKVKMEGTTNVVVEGIDKQLVGQFAADIRSLRPPEPYKGKGIRYKGEHVRRKVGKAGA